MNADQRRRMREAFQSPETLLHACVRDNDIARLRQLLPRCRAQDVNYLDSSWGSPLHVAMWCDGSAAVPLLLRAGADPLTPGWGDGPSSPIMLAIRQGKCRMLERLWRNVAPETHANGTTGRPYMSCIAQAATFGQVCAMEHLLSWWDAWSQDAKDCALTAAAGRWHFYIVDVLLSQFTYSSEILLQSLQKASSFPFYAPGELRKPEYTAADYLHQQQIIKRLIDAGADPNEAHATGIPLILHTAQSIDLAGALKVLLEQGSEGWTPLHCLALHMDNDPVGEVALLAVDLIDQGSDLEARALLQDQEQQVPREYVIHDLMKKASSASGAVKSHWTPLQLAAERGAVGMVKTLLEHGADPSSEDEHGKRATEVAVESTRLDEFPEARDAVLQLLLECYGKDRS
ncbi:hypothetical protein K4F52_009524 [Lecanicillium sp. MT-2017a]|nr:hypothetical protein K4F52_009524 [Lecanicillium sp. MT-2017a]